MKVQLQTGEFVELSGFTTKNFKHESLNLHRVIIEKETFENGVFLSCDMRSIEFISVGFRDIQFVSCQLMVSTFYRCSFEKVEMINCSLFSSQILEPINVEDFVISNSITKYLDYPKATPIVFTNCDFHAADNL